MKKPKPLPLSAKPNKTRKPVENELQLFQMRKKGVKIVVEARNIAEAQRKFLAIKV